MRHWWREWIMETWRLSDAVWEQQLEEATMGYQTERQEYLETHPRPTLKSVMVGLSGQGRMVT